ncbi:hypothetical protein PRIPAC_95580 [Pristionchus pacificus]|nr:hypothetical protein PRIPAC_95580 [Pristionchus pacificus]
MVMHAKICDAKIKTVKTEEEEEEEVIQESLSTVARRPALRRFDYAIRGLRTVEAKTCPYCEVEMASCHMVEHHSRRAHANERTAVFGCTECRRWCTTTMALIKHWSKMECPNGRITVRKPIEATEAKNQKRNVTQIRYACNTCGKGFFSRLGVKYHVDKVCESSMAIDVKKYIKEGTQFVSIETLKGFHLELVSSDPSSIPSCLTSFPRFQGALQPKQSPPSEKSL